MVNTQALAERLRAIFEFTSHVQFLTPKDREALDQAARLLAGLGWQPIESAPKDQSILATSSYTTIYEECPVWHVKWNGDCFSSIWDGEPMWDATHWMPKPLFAPQEGV